MTGVTDDTLGHGGPRVLSVSPAAEPEVVAALVAAVHEVWPRPVAVDPEPEHASGSAWRFSGRWWAKPAAVRRDRPWASR